MTVHSHVRAQELYEHIVDELRQADRCGVVIGLETEVHVIRAEAVDSWAADPTRVGRLLFVADHKTTLGDVEWLLSR